MQLDMLRSNLFEASVQFDDFDIFFKEIFSYFMWRYIRYFASLMVFWVQVDEGWLVSTTPKMKTFSVGQMSHIDYRPRDIFFPIYLLLLLFVRVPIFRTCETTRLAPVLQSCDTNVLSVFLVMKSSSVFLLRHLILHNHSFCIF